MHLQFLMLLVNKEDQGLGKCSWRSSRLVKNGDIHKMFTELEVEGNLYEVSDADTMLNYINPSAVKPQLFTLFTKVGCPDCVRAKANPNERGMEYEEVILGKEVTSHSLYAVSGAITTP